MTADDVYRRQNLGNFSGIGARCALVLVDFVNGFVDAAQFGGGEERIRVPSNA